MKDFYQKTKEEYIKDMAEILSQFKSYKDGRRDALEQAQKYYNENYKKSLRSTNHTILTQDDYPCDIIFSEQMGNRLTLVGSNNKRVTHNEDLVKYRNLYRDAISKNSCKVFKGTLEEAINFLKENRSQIVDELNIRKEKEQEDRLFNQEKMEYSVTHTSRNSDGTNPCDYDYTVTAYSEDEAIEKVIDNNHLMVSAMDSFECQIYGIAY